MTTATARAEASGSIRTLLYAVGVSGAAMAAAAGALYGANAAAGVLVGAAIAFANLAVITLTVRALTGGDARSMPWAFIGVVKMVALFGGMYVLLTAGVVELLPLAAGYGCLPLGIFAAQLKPPARTRPGTEES